MIFVDMNERADMSDRDQVKYLIQFIGIGIKVLSARIALFVCLTLTFSLFAYATYYSDPIRLGIAATFALMVFLPIIRLDSKLSEEKKIVKGD